MSGLRVLDFVVSFDGLDISHSGAAGLVVFFRQRVRSPIQAIKQTLIGDLVKF